MSYKQKYLIQKHHAGYRGIEWHFTFNEWLAWWGNDIANRGRKAGQLVMARIGDIGPYHPDNCIKKTMNENLSEGTLGKPKSLETRKKMSEFVRPKRSQETIEKHRQSLLEYYKKKKDAL